MARVEKQQTEPTKPRGPVSPCHGVAIRGINLIVIDDRGQETVIGTIVYCGEGQMDMNSKPYRCYRMLGFRPKPNAIPAGLTKEIIRSLCEFKNPTYEQSAGYHIKFADGRWRNIVDLRHGQRTFAQMAPKVVEDHRAAAAGEHNDDSPAGTPQPTHDEEQFTQDPEEVEF